MSSGRFCRLFGALSRHFVFKVAKSSAFPHSLYRNQSNASYQLASRFMSSAPEDSVVNLTTAQTLEEAKKGVPVIDVRELVEIHNTGLIPGAVNIPLGHLEEAMAMSAADFKERFGFDKPGTGDRLIMSCQSGNRSKRATIALQKLGFSNVVNNGEGWKGYEEYMKSK